MKITFLGDSITVGYYFEKNENGEMVGKKACPSFADLICKEYKFDRIESLAQSGSSYSSTCDTFPEDSITNKCKRVGDSDVLILAAGTNDLTTKVKLGNKHDKRDISFYGAVDYTLRTLKKKHIDKIIVITPLHRENEMSEQGFSLTDITNAIKFKCNKYNIPVICGFDAPFDLRKEMDREKFSQDGLHPNAEAHIIYARYIIEQIKNQYLF